MTFFRDLHRGIWRSRNAWRWAAIEEFARDTRYALRTLRRAPGFSAIAVICLSLGIGATTTIFSLIYGVLLRPLPYRAPHELVAVWNSVAHDKGSKMFVPYSDLDNWREHARSFSDLAGVTWATNGRTLTGQGTPQKVLVIPATLPLFPLLGVPPALGRTFAEEDMSRGCTVVLAHRFWMNAMGADASILGSQLRFDDQSCTVVGVMPAGFAFFPEPTEAWSLITPNSDIARKPDVSGVGVFARLKPGLSLSSARAELRTLAAKGTEESGMEFKWNRASILCRRSSRGLPEEISA